MKFFRIPFNPDEDFPASEARRNRLHRYIQSQSIEDMTRMATEISPEVKQIVATNVQSLLGYLPPQEFSATITSSKENLQNLLASAMLTGYFMHAMETRMGMEALLEVEPPRDSHSEQLEPEPRTEAPSALERDLQELLDSGKELLRDPRDLFKQEGFPRERLGRFLHKHELQQEIETPDKFNIQLEINTRMDRSELVELLKELRKFQSGSQAAEPQAETGESLDSPFEPNE